MTDQVAHEIISSVIGDIRVIRGYFLYAGTSGSSGGRRPSSSSSFNGKPAGVTMRALTKMTRFFLLCCSTLVRKALPTSGMSPIMGTLSSVFCTSSRKTVPFNFSFVGTNQRGHHPEKN